MSIGAADLWLIPFLPLAAAAMLAFFRSRRSALGSGLAIATMAAALVLSIGALTNALETQRTVHNFTWLHLGTGTLKLGFVLDPLAGFMLVMISFITLLVLIYSTAYMHEDRHYTRFFCFLSFFAGAMLGVVIANSLVLLFICWELVGVASFLLIGFWFERPAAAAAARKAFITTRVGDIFFLLGIVWLINLTGTQLCYDNGLGCLERPALRKLATLLTPLGLTAATAIALLLFAGAAGKSGQVPFHVWLPDAMEGPTPVSALIHAATMVAAGVFLVARTFPLMDADPFEVPGISPALTVITWVGAMTAVFAALIAVAQNDLKRILAYSTVSQLGYMMLGLGTGGVGAGIFHLITHAFFKALLFLGAGSVIHGLHGEQNIFKMGGLRKSMPLTFATYAVGMLALTGFPLLFSGFWSKDEILHSASLWPLSKIPFLLGLFGAFLTAFYMTRQVLVVFLAERATSRTAHESGPAMIAPLIILAGFAVLLGVIGTPAWPWFESSLDRLPTSLHLEHLKEPEFLGLLLLSSLVVFSGYAAGWYLYRELKTAHDPLVSRAPSIHPIFANRFYVDEFYHLVLVRPIARLGDIFNAFESALGGSLRAAGTGLMASVGWLGRLFDTAFIDRTFDGTCGTLESASQSGRRVQNGQVQFYLRFIGLAFALLVLLLAWGCRP